MRGVKFAAKISYLLPVDCFILSRQNFGITLLLSFSSLVAGDPLKIKNLIRLFALLSCFAPVVLQAQDNTSHINFDFYGDTIALQLDPSFRVSFNEPLSDQSVKAFNDKMSSSATSRLSRRFSRTNLNLNWMTGCTTSL
ncbi:MAG: hypothetical protein WDO16_19960 [Bacteroidota bacterium]